MRFPSRFVTVLLAGVGAAALPSTSCATVYRMSIQSHASLGAKCLDIPNARLFRGVLVQMWDCMTSGAAQTFVYDDATLELKIGDVCVTAWGTGRPEDPIALETCKGGASQHWKAAAVGDYYQLVGIGDLCLDLHYARKDNGATLQLFACKQGEPAQLWALIEAK